MGAAVFFLAGVGLVGFFHLAGLILGEADGPKALLCCGNCD